MTRLTNLFIVRPAFKQRHKCTCASSFWNDVIPWCVKLRLCNFCFFRPRKIQYSFELSIWQRFLTWSCCTSPSFIHKPPKVPEKSRVTKLLFLWYLLYHKISTGSFITRDTTLGVVFFYVGRVKDFICGHNRNLISKTKTFFLSAVQNWTDFLCWKHVYLGHMRGLCTGELEPGGGGVGGGKFIPKCGKLVKIIVFLAKFSGGKLPTPIFFSSLSPQCVSIV